MTRSAVARPSVPRRSRRVAAGLLAVAVIGSMSACGTGKDWVEEGLNPSGNGQFVTVGTIQAQNVTLVQGPQGSKSLTLVARLFNTGTTPDALIGASMGATPGTDAKITNSSVPIAPGPDAASVGFNSTNFVNFYSVDVPTATYVPVTLKFKDAGQTTVQVLVVPPVGYYEGIAPTPPTA